jgi:hypothetical protein
MPTRTTAMLHKSLEVPSPAPVLGTAFDVADVHVHNMLEGMPPAFAGGDFIGILEGIHIRLGSATSATKVTVRVCADAAGDYTLVPDTEAALVAGITTNTTKCAAFRVSLPAFQLFGGDELYLFAHVDDATSSPTMLQSCITWRE